MKMCGQEDGAEKTLNSPPPMGKPKLQLREQILMKTI